MMVMMIMMYVVMFRWCSYIREKYTTVSYCYFLTTPALYISCERQNVFMIWVRSCFFLDKYVANGDWTVRNTTIQNRVMQYSCCQHPFSDVTYTFILDRKPAYHVLYLIVPCIIISCLSMLTFFLPPDCGERVGLSITLVLAMAVYLLIVSDILPETSDYVPRLGLYYMVIMGELALVVAANAVVLRCHFSRSKPPTFIKRFSRTHKQQITIVKPLRAKIKSVNESVNTTPNSKEQLQEEVKEDEDIETWPEYWKDFARRLDFVFLGSFALLFLVSTLCTLFVRKKYALWKQTCTYTLFQLARKCILWSSSENNWPIDYTVVKLTKDKEIILL